MPVPPIETPTPASTEVEKPLTEPFLTVTDEPMTSIPTTRQVTLPQVPLARIAKPLRSSVTLFAAMTIPLSPPGTRTFDANR